MSLAKQVVVRYRSEGHVRFFVPGQLRNAKAAQKLRQGLLGLPGVLRVDFKPGQDKLSIRFSEEDISLKSLAQSLYRIVTEIERATQELASRPLDRHKGADTGLAATRLKSHFQGATEALRALGSLAQGGSGKKPVLTAENEALIFDFFTDLLVLYLIKVHWHLIMGHWIKNPWQYRGEWMATLYLIFLQVRSKKTK